MVWKKNLKPIPDSNRIKLDEKILAKYAGEYEIPSVFGFSVIRMGGRFYIKTAGQEPVEIFADTEIKNFYKGE